MLIQSAMPTYDVVIAEHLMVAADPQATFTAARELDLLTVRTPLLTLSMWLRGLPVRLSWQGNSAPAPLGDWRRHDLAGVGITWPATEPRDRLRRSGKVLAARHRMARCIARGFQWLRRIWLGQDRRKPFRLALRRVRLAADLRMPDSDYRSRLASAVSAILVDDPAIRRPHPASDAAADQGQLDDLLGRLTDAESTWSRWLTGVAPEHRSTARNMLHYWAIRQYDLRDLQDALRFPRAVVIGSQRAARGGHVASGEVRNLRHARHGLPAAHYTRGTRRPGPRTARRRTQELLEPEPVDRVTRIMVTLPSSAATDPAFVRESVERGMNIARINCAHDDAEAWRSMAEHVRQAAEATGRKCLVAMDLAWTEELVPDHSKPVRAPRSSDQPGMRSGR